MGDVKAVSSQEERAEEFAAFFRVEHERLFQTLVLVCGDRTQAEDLAQEAMARGFEQWDRVRRADNPAAYVYRIAFNLNRRIHRRARLGRGTLASETADPMDPAAAVEARAEARSALAALPPALREALVLVEWAGLTADEAGRVLRIEAVSVRGRLHRARRILRERLGGDEDE
jgi:RNA polymerase sigma factor (sigma-70 family)